MAEKLRFEYGTLECTLEVVDSTDEAIDYIMKNGSAHTDSIITKNGFYNVHIIKYLAFICSSDFNDCYHYDRIICYNQKF